jgi:hypothetical protein
LPPGHYLGMYVPRVDCGFSRKSACTPAASYGDIHAVLAVAANIMFVDAEKALHSMFQDHPWFPFGTPQATSQSEALPKVPTVW